MRRMNLMNFNGERMDAIRTQKQITQRTLAAAVGCTEMTIRNWTRGVSEPDASDLVKIAECLDVTIMDLFDKGDAA